MRAIRRDLTGELRKWYAPRTFAQNRKRRLRVPTDAGEPPVDVDVWQMRVLHRRGVREERAFVEVPRELPAMPGHGLDEPLRLRRLDEDIGIERLAGAWLLPPSLRIAQGRIDHGPLDVQDRDPLEVGDGLDRRVRERDAHVARQQRLGLTRRTHAIKQSTRQNSSMSAIVSVHARAGGAARARGRARSRGPWRGRGIRPGSPLMRNPIA